MSSSDTGGSKGRGTGNSASHETAAALKRNNAPKSTPLSSAGIAAAEARRDSVKKADNQSAFKAKEAFERPSLAGLTSVTAAINAKVLLAERYAAEYNTLEETDPEEAASYVGDILKLSMYKAYRDAAVLEKQKAKTAPHNKYWQDFLAWIDEKIRFRQIQLKAASIQLAGDEELGIRGSYEDLAQARAAAAAREEEFKKQLREAEAKGDEMGKRYIHYVREQVAKLIDIKMKEAAIARAKADEAEEALKKQTATLEATRSINSSKIKELTDTNSLLLEALAGAQAEATKSLEDVKSTFAALNASEDNLKIQLASSETGLRLLTAQTSITEELNQRLQTQITSQAEVNEHIQEDLRERIRNLERQVLETGDTNRALSDKISSLEQANAQLAAKVLENHTKASREVAALELAQAEKESLQLALNTLKLTGRSQNADTIRLLEKGIASLRSGIAGHIEEQIAGALKEKEDAEKKAALLAEQLERASTTSNAESSRLREELATIRAFADEASDRTWEFAEVLKSTQEAADRDRAQSALEKGELQEQLKTAKAGSSAATDLAARLAATEAALREAETRAKAATEQLAALPKKRPIRLSGIFTRTHTRAQVLTPGRTLLKRSTATGYKWKKCGTRRGMVWRCRGNAQTGGTRKKRSKKTRRRRH